MAPLSEQQRPNIYTAGYKATEETECKWIIGLRRYLPFWQHTPLKLGNFLCTWFIFSFPAKWRISYHLFLFPSRRKNHSIHRQEYSLPFSQFFCTDSIKSVILVLCFFMALCGYVLLWELTWYATTKLLSWLKVPGLGDLMSFLGPKPKTGFLP